MDRNLWWGVRKAVGSLVALRKESVDRNDPHNADCNCRNGSLSARRAWIEMLMKCQVKKYSGSLSARRAWIEIKYVVKDSDFSGSRSPQGERG